MSVRRKSTWTSRRSATTMTMKVPRVRRDRRRHRRHRLSASRRHPFRIRRRNPATVSACRLSWGQIHPPLTCRTRLRIGRPLPWAPIRHHPAHLFYIRRCISRAVSCRLIRIIPSRTCILNCCRIIFCRRTCTRYYAAFIRVTRDCIRPTRRTVCIIPIRLATSTAASSATRCSARRMGSKYVCVFFFHTSRLYSCFDLFLIYYPGWRSSAYVSIWFYCRVNNNFDFSNSYFYIFTIFLYKKYYTILF